MTEDTSGQTRRTFIAGLFAALAVAHSGAKRVRAGVGYTITLVRSIDPYSVARPNQFSYELLQLEDRSVLQFADDEAEQQLFVFGDNNPEVSPIEGGGGIDLPMALDFQDMEEATAFFLSGVMAILLGAAAVFRNPAAGVMWSVSFVVLVVAGLFGFGLELYWLSIIMTVILLMVGLVVRWSR